MKTQYITWTLSTHQEIKLPIFYTQQWILIQESDNAAKGWKKKKKSTHIQKKKKAHTGN